MTLINYTYTVVQYVHDPGAGEVLNVGVVLFAPHAQFLQFKFDPTYARLSKAFAGFDGEHFRRAIHRFEHALSTLAEHWTEGLFAGEKLPADVGQVAKIVWPDPDMSFRYIETRGGVSEDLEETLDSIFDRMVTSQYDKRRLERRSDEEVWTVYNKVFSRHAVSGALQEHTFRADEFEFKFDHSFKNGRWHVLQPLSLDYSEAQGIQRKVTEWLGKAVALEGNQDLDMLYLLLGPPQSSAHQEAYQKAKRLLEKRLKVNHQIVEEREAEAFAVKLEDFMREHRILEEAEN